MHPGCLIVPCALAAEAASAPQASTVEAPAGPGEPAPLPVAALLGLAVVLLAIALTPRVVARYRRRLLELMNSAVASREQGRLDALDRPGAVEWLIAVMHRRHRAVLAVLCVSVAVFALAAGIAYAYVGAEQRLDRFSQLMSVLLFAALGGPVVLLGVSATRFDHNFWTYFAPPTFFTVAMNIVMAALARDETLHGQEAVAFVHRIAWLLGGLTVLGVAVQALVRHGRLQGLARRMPKSFVGRALLMAAGCFVAAVVLGIVADPAGGEGSELSVQGGAILAAVFFAPPLIWGFHACIGDRSGRVVFPLLALSGLAFVSLTAWLAPRLGDLLADSYALQAWQGRPGFHLAAAAPGVLAAAGAAYAVLSWIGVAYERKLFSDAQFQVFAWMLTIAGMVAFLEAFSADGDLFGPPSLGVGLAAAVALALYLSLIRLMRSPPVRVRLLLLRVFSYDLRGEHLLDELAYRWRYVGPIIMIGGPDMVRASIDAGEASNFLRGRFDDDFIHDEQVLENKAVNLDDRADPDGRFRINEFFCRQDMWQQAVQRLMGMSDTILLDLRGFDAGRAGTAFEIAALARLGALARTVLLTDAQTDLQAVAAALSRDGTVPPPSAAQTIEVGQHLDGDAVFRALVEIAVASRAGAVTGTVAPTPPPA